MNGPLADRDGRLVIIGYGNSLRGDDGAGWHAAAALAQDPRLAGVDVLSRHQLTVELAADIAHARLAVLVDACASGVPGTVSVRQVQSSYPLAAAWSHHLPPDALVDLTKALYGTCPPVFLVTVTGTFFGYGDRLSPAVRRALPRVADTIASLQAAHARS